MALNAISASKSPANRAGLVIFLFLLSACQSIDTPEQVTTTFWEAMVQGDIETARDHATQETRSLVNKQQYLEAESLQTGVVTLEGSKAKVATIISLKKPQKNDRLAFDTILLKEHDRWKVDYQQTLNNISIPALGDIFKSLQEIGDTINKELEHQIPLFEQQIRSFSEELLKQLETFRRQLEKPHPPEKEKSGSGTI